jgi:hypothetical protein
VTLLRLSRLWSLGLSTVSNCRPVMTLQNNMAPIVTKRPVPPSTKACLPVHSSYRTESGSVSFVASVDLSYHYSFNLPIRAEPNRVLTIYISALRMVAAYFYRMLVSTYKVKVYHDSKHHNPYKYTTLYIKERLLGWVSLACRRLHQKHRCYEHWMCTEM